MLFLIRIFGFSLSLLDKAVLEKLTFLLSRLYLLFPSRRKQTIVSNLKYAFPSWSKEKIRDVTIVSFARTIEMGFFSIIYPHMDKDSWRQTLQVSQAGEEKLIELRKSSRPVLCLLPHLCLFESLATSPLFRPFGGKKFGAVYRPNKNPKLNNWINLNREKTGIKTFSRKKGLLEAKSFLKDGNWLTVLFDQNAGDRGMLDLFMQRLVSYSSLPDSLAKSTGAISIFLFPKRIDFFRTELRIFELENQSEVRVSQQAHRLLEQILNNEENGCPEWLWAHGKWKIHARVESRYQMLVKRKQLILGKKIPRITNFYIRMPNWLGDVIMAIPILFALRKGRPDVRFTLVAKSQFIPLLKKFNLGEDYLALPKRGLSYFLNFRELLKCKPENYLLFTNSLRGDIEAYVSGSRQRFGLNLPNRSRPLLTHNFDAAELGEEEFNKMHQTELWEQMARHFGLKETVSRDPVELGANRQKWKIGIVPGSSNSPLKRWAPENWVFLIKQLSTIDEGLDFHLYGTNQDKVIADEVSSSFDSTSVRNHAGKTDLSQLAEELSSCRLVIGNDTGSVHLANMVGTPVIVLFGPTNLSRTKPFFNSNKVLIESPESHDINSLEPEVVFRRIISIL